MSRAAREYVVVPGEILHELARQLDRIPGHAVDAGDAGEIDTRQEVVQHVPELVEQGYDIGVRNQRTAPGVRVGRREIAHQITDRQGRLAVEVLAYDALVDPGTAALAGAGEEVHVESADGRAVLVAQREISDVVVPLRNALLRTHLHSIKSPGDREQPIDDRLDRKVLAQLFVRDRKLLLFELLEPVGGIPGGQPVACKPGEFVELLACGFAGAAGEFAQETQHLVRGTRHLRRERVLGKVVEADEAGCLEAQRENPVDVGRIVPGGIVAPIGCARDPCPIQRLAKLA